MNLEAITHLKSGYIFPVKNEDGILQALEWFYANSEMASIMAEEAYNEAIEKFNIQELIQRSNRRSDRRSLRSHID